MYNNSRKAQTQKYTPSRERMPCSFHNGDVRYEANYTTRKKKITVDIARQSFANGNLVETISCSFSETFLCYG